MAYCQSASKAYLRPLVLPFLAGCMVTLALITYFGMRNSSIDLGIITIYGVPDLPVHVQFLFLGENVGHSVLGLFFNSVAVVLLTKSIRLRFAAIFLLGVGTFLILDYLPLLITGTGQYRTTPGEYVGVY